MSDNPDDTNHERKGQTMPSGETKKVSAANEGPEPTKRLSGGIIAAIAVAGVVVLAVAGIGGAAIGQTVARAQHSSIGESEHGGNGDRRGPGNADHGMRGDGDREGGRGPQGEKFHQGKGAGKSGPDHKESGKMQGDGGQMPSGSTPQETAPEGQAPQGSPDGN